MLRLSDNPSQRWPIDRPLMEDLDKWWVVRTKPRNEKALAWELARMGVGYYLPMLTRRTTRRDNGKTRKSVVCLFPGYISITGYEDRKMDILRTGRVIKVINAIDQERFVSELENIRRALEHIKILSLSNTLATGHRVMITSGPMQGVEGVVTDMDNPDRISLNVEMFNRAITVKVSPDMIESVETCQYIPAACAAAL